MLRHVRMRSLQDLNRAVGVSMYIAGRCALSVHFKAVGKAAQTECGQEFLGVILSAVSACLGPCLDLARDFNTEAHHDCRTM